MSAPPISDRLAVSLRVFAGPQFVELPDSDKPAPKAKRPPPPASKWTLIFDCETTTLPGQALRFGVYQFRHGDDLDEAGVFYEPEGVTADELATLQSHTAAIGLTLRTREQFVDEVFFARAYQLRAAVVGFNLPFDISRLAISHATTKTPVEGIADAMHGGFTFKLSRQKIYPNVRVKHLSQRAALISFAATMGQRDSRGQRRRDMNTSIRRGHFIDVKTLAGALFARGFSLASLSQFLKVENSKLEFDEFDGPITDEMARYALRDVQATWECYRECAARLNRLGLTRTAAEKIYSEASIGKGYLREMGIEPWRKLQPHFPRDLLGKIMGSYYGGRSEVRIRRELRQVMLCDFLSMYPTVCTLMGLWPFVIANGMTWRDATAETRAMIETIDLAALQSKETWRQLATLVRVIPDADIFPVRAPYEMGAQSTIGANYLSADQPLWFTLADCIAAKILTGKTPNIVEAITFVPGAAQPDLRAIEIGGNSDYCVNPAQDDFFKRLIELRQATKRKRNSSVGDAWLRIDTEQNSLKIAANSTSYGIFIEVNVETRKKRKAVTVHSATCAPFSFASDKVEMPGTFFHPLLGTLITGAARLMLATAERLATDQELDWSFCDTDSIAIAKPDAMQADEFDTRALSVVDWFTPLNPYDFGGSILKIEDVNKALHGKGSEPLYCWAVSSKRYALFNLGKDGQPILRKVSAHGLGHLLPPYREVDASRDLPTPDKSVLGDGIERWHCDFWHQIICAALSGNPDQVSRDYHPRLSSVALSRYSATTPELLRWFKTYNRDRTYRDQVKPFGFLLSMTQAMDFGGETFEADGKGKARNQKRSKPVAPYDRDHTKAIAAAFDRETGETVSASSLKTYADALAQYHIQPESKFLNANYSHRGVTLRRHVRMIATRHIGKEAHDWETQAVLGLNANSMPQYGDTHNDPARAFAELTTLLKLHGMAKVAKAVGTTPKNLKQLGAATFPAGIAERLHVAFELLSRLQADRDSKSQAYADLIRCVGLRGAARQLGVDPSNLRRKMQNFVNGTPG